MSITLGEKLRQAREARGFSVGEVAEQTRISPLYIKSIEEDDYRTLPGGIFNKGFVKSYARHVGVDEQEALHDYSALVGNQTVAIEDQPKTYRPQVLTDDRAQSSGLRTIVFAVIMLGLMAVGILALMNYLNNNRSETVVSNNTNTSVNVNLANAANSADAAASVSSVSSAAAPSMNDLKVELKAVSEPVYFSTTTDGTTAKRLLNANETINVEPKESLKFSYARALAAKVQLSLNGKQIALPPAPANPKRNVIEVEITRENLASVWQSGRVSFDAPAAP